MIGRVWAWDIRHAGAYCLDQGELVHAPFEPDRGRFAWDAVAAVDFGSIEAEFVIEATTVELQLRAYLNRCPSTDSHVFPSFGARCFCGADTWDDTIDEAMREEREQIAALEGGA